MYKVALTIKHNGKQISITLVQDSKNEKQQLSVKKTNIVNNLSNKASPIMKAHQQFKQFDDTKLAQLTLK